MTRSIDSILIPTDGSEGALAGARRGIDFARIFDADIVVISVVEEPEVDNVSSRVASGADGDELRFEREAESAVETVTAVAERRSGPEIDVAGTVERGVPHRAIAAAVDEHGIDVIAMGTRGRTGIERFLLGSVTEKVLRTVDVPVLAVPPGAGDASDGAGEYESVLLPTDGSEGAAIAVRWGVDLADAFDSMLHAVFSVDTSSLSASTDPDELFAALEETGEAALESVRDRAREAGVSVTGTLASGPPAKVILAHVEENEIDVVVIGTHGRSGVERHLLGSVTENVVRNADVPVFCVPMTAADPGDPRGS